MTGAMLDIALPVDLKAKNVTGGVPLYTTKVIERKRSITFVYLSVSYLLGYDSLTQPTWLLYDMGNTVTHKVRSSIQKIIRAITDKTVQIISSLKFLLNAKVITSPNETTRLYIINANVPLILIKVKGRAVHPTFQQSRITFPVTDAIYSTMGKVKITEILLMNMFCDLVISPPKS